jgi:hypothetical protein
VAAQTSLSQHLQLLSTGRHTSTAPQCPGTSPVPHSPTHRTVTTPTVVTNQLMTSSSTVASDWPTPSNPKQLAGPAVNQAVAVAKPAAACSSLQLAPQPPLYHYIAAGIQQPRAHHEQCSQLMYTHSQACGSLQQRLRGNRPRQGAQQQHWHPHAHTHHACLHHQMSAPAPAIEGAARRHA